MEEIINLFTSVAWLRNMGNDYDCYIYPNIPRSVIARVKNNFQIEDNETVLLVRDTSWSSFNEGVVITDLAIRQICDNDNPNDIYVWSWDCVKTVTQEGQDICLWGYDNDNSYISFTPKTEFLKHASGSAEVYAEAFQELFQSFADYSGGESEEDRNKRIIENIVNLYNSEEWEALYNLIINEGYVATTPDWLWQSAREIGKIDECFDILTNCLHDENVNEDKSPIYRVLGYIFHYDKENYDLARSCLLAASTNGELDDLFGESDECCAKEFVLRDRDERKFLMPVRRYTTLFQEVVNVFEMRKLPRVKFLNGSLPQCDVLYIEHPLVDLLYIPFENHELLILEDQVRELCEIAQGLGATQITVECINSSSIEDYSNKKNDTSGHVSYKVISAEGNRSVSGNSKFIDEISRSICMHQEYVPQVINMPDNLLWYNSMPSWQRLYEQRMRGSIVHHEERISTKKNKVVQNNELQKIGGEVRVLFTEGGGEWTSEMDEQFSEHEEATISIQIDFAPLHTLSSTTSSSPNNNKVGINPIIESVSLESSEFAKCPNCGADITNGQKFCGSCGTKIQIKNICKQCGEIIPLNVKFCPLCGSKQ